MYLVCNNCGDGFNIVYHDDCSYNVGYITESGKKKPIVRSFCNPLCVSKYYKNKK